MAMKEGERQVAPTIDGIRRDHVARYEFAARVLPPRSRVVDFACGIGYGANTLACKLHHVYAFDIDADALEYANKHYAHPGVEFRQRDASAPGQMPESDAAVCFETIEHVADPRPLLRALREAAPVLLASVPNEAVMPWSPHPGFVTAFHHRHYTRHEFTGLLQECGWKVVEWYGQEGPESEVEKGANGRTLIASCVRGESVKQQDGEPEDQIKAGLHVAILGLGPSVRQYLELTKRLGGRKALCDETWAINALGDVFACDRIFHMDDVRIQQIRADASPQSNIAHMLKWLKTTRTPVVTSRAHPDYPALEEFPLAEVLTKYPYGYFNSTAAYAVAYAIHAGATKITVFGNDFTYPDAHDAEKGRACVEFWLGIAAAKGIELSMPKTTSLMDACNSQADRFYGYDTLDLAMTNEGGEIRVARTERAALPTADEIENRYDHRAHPNPLFAPETIAHAGAPETK